MYNVRFSKKNIKSYVTDLKEKYKLLLINAKIQQKKIKRLTKKEN